MSGVALPPDYVDPRQRDYAEDRAARRPRILRRYDPLAALAEPPPPAETPSPEILTTRAEQLGAEGAP